MQAKIVAVVEEDGTYYLVVGQGDHDCIRYQLSRSLLIKLAQESIELVLKKIK